MKERRDAVKSKRRKRTWRKRRDVREKGKSGRQRRTFFCFLNIN